MLLSSPTNIVSGQPQCSVVGVDLPPPHMTFSPNHTPLESTPLLSSVSEIKAFIHKSLDEKKPVFASFHVSDNDLETIYQFLQTSGYRKFRISCSDKYNLTLRYMPSLAHDIAARELASAILSSLSSSPHLQPGFDYLDVLVRAGSATVRLNHPHQLYKEADESLTARGNDGVPLVIIEVGVSEVMWQLRSDARHWLLHTPVKMAILIDIGPEDATSENDGLPTPIIRVEHVENVVLIDGRHSNEPQPYTTAQENWTHEANIKDYRLPGRHLFVDGTPEHQAFAAGNHDVVVTREKVLKIRGWIREMWRP